MAKICVIIFEGVEEIEVVTPIDILKRAGVSVDVVSISDEKQVCGRSEITICADALLPEVIENRYDALVIPGGPGHKSLMRNMSFHCFLKTHFEDDKIIAAICAAPKVLHHVGILNDLEFTAHKSVVGFFKREVTNQSVVESKNVITSQGAGTAIEFGLRIAQRFVGEEDVKALAESIHYEF